MDKRASDTRVLQTKESKAVATLQSELHRVQHLLAQQSKDFSAEREATEARLHELQQKLSLALNDNHDIKTENASLHLSLKKFDSSVPKAITERGETWCSMCEIFEQQRKSDTSDKTSDAVKLATLELERKLKREQKQAEKTLQDKFEDRERELLGDNKRLSKQLARANAAKDQNENRQAAAIGRTNEAIILRLQTEAAAQQQQAAKQEELLSDLRQQLEALQSEHASHARRTKDAEQRVADFRLRQGASEKAKIAAEAEHAQQLTELKNTHKAEKTKLEEKAKSQVDACTSKITQQAEATRKSYEQHLKEMQGQIASLTEHQAAEKQGLASDAASWKKQLEAERKRSAQLLEQAQHTQAQLSQDHAKQLKAVEEARLALNLQLQQALETLESQQQEQAKMVALRAECHKLQKCAVILEQKHEQDTVLLRETSEKALEELRASAHAMQVKLSSATDKNAHLEAELLSMSNQLEEEKTRFQVELTSKLEAEKAMQTDREISMETEHQAEILKLQQYVSSLEAAATESGAMYQELIREAQVSQHALIENERQIYEEKLTQFKEQSAAELQQQQERNSQLEARSASLEKTMAENTLQLESVNKEFGKAIAESESRQRVFNELLQRETENSQREVEKSQSEQADRIHLVEMQATIRLEQFTAAHASALQTLTLQHEAKLADLEVTHEKEIESYSHQLQTLKQDTAESLSELEMCKLAAKEEMQELKITHTKAVEHLTVTFEKEKEEQMSKAQAVLSMELHKLTRLHEGKLADVQCAHNEELVAIQEVCEEKNSCEKSMFETKLKEAEAKFTDAKTQHDAAVLWLQEKISFTQSIYGKDVKEMEQKLTSMQAKYEKDIGDMKGRHEQEILECKQQLAAASNEAAETKQRYQNRILELSSEVSNLNNIKTVQEQAIQSQRQAFDKLSANYDAMEKKWEDLSQAHTQFQEKAVSESKQLQEGLLEARLQNENESKKHQDSLLLAQTECAEAKKQIDVLQQTCSTAEMQFHNLQLTYDAATSQLETSQQTLEELQRAHMDATKLHTLQFESLREAHEALESAFGNTTKQLEDLQLAYDAATKHASQLETSHNETTKQHTLQLQSLQEAKATVESAYNDVATQLQTLQQAKQELQLSYDAATKQHAGQLETSQQATEELQRAHIETIRQQEEAKEALQSAFDDVTKQLGVSQHALKDLQLTYDAATKQHAIQLETLQQTKADVQQSYDDASKQHTTTLETLQQTQEALRQLRLAKESLQCAHDTQLVTFQQTEKDLEQVKHELQLAHEDVTQQRAAVLETKEEIQRLEHTFKLQESKQQDNFECLLQTKEREYEQQLHSAVLKERSEQDQKRQAAMSKLEQEMDGRVSLLNKELEEVSASHQTLYVMKEQHAGVIATFQLKLTQAEEKCVALESSRADLLARVSRAEAQREIATSHHQSISSLQKQHADALESAHVHSAELKASLEDKHNAMSTMKQQFQQKIEQLEASHLAMLAELEATKAQHQEELIQNREDFNETLANLQEKHQEQQLSAQEKYQEQQQASVATHKQQLSHLQQQLTTLQETHHSTLVQLAEIQAESKEFAEQLMASKAPERTKSDTDVSQKKAKEFEGEIAKLKKQHSVELMKHGHKIKMEANKDNELACKQAVEVAEVAMEERLRREFNRETERLKRELAKQSELHTKKLESALTRRPLQEMNPLTLQPHPQSAAEEAHLERMVQEANQQNKALQLQRTENPGTFLMGVRRLHLSVVGGVLSVRIGGGFITFPEFVKKYGKDEGQRIFDNASDENSEWASMGSKYGLDENRPEQEGDEKPKKSRKSLAVDPKMTPASAVKERASKLRRRSNAPS